MKKLNVNINGNKKLKNNDDIRFMIWNLPSVKTCPFATELCKSSCYSRKAEKQYPAVLPSREKNYIDSLSTYFVFDMIYTIERHLNSKAFKNKLVIFRIHESGDFYNLEYTQKWISIARYFENDDRIIFLAYTKSLLYFVKLGYNTVNFPSNFIVRSSLWKDTEIDNLYMTRDYNFPIYTALTEKEMESEKANGRKFFTCKCDNCSTCKACWNNDIKDIIVKIH